MSATKPWKFSLYGFCHIDSVNDVTAFNKVIGDSLSNSGGCAGNN